VAQGVVKAMTEERISMPVLARLSGTNVEEGRRILKESGLPILTADTLAEAARRIVEALAASRETLTTTGNGGPR
jgi:malate-CoA ligase subunit beta